MAISVADNFSYKGGKPLDARTKYDSVADMKNATASDLYDGCLAYVVATKKNYQYDSSNTVDPDTGKWRELETGGGGTGGGHVIENGSGAQMTSRDNLQFIGGSDVTDDSANGRTVVRAIEGVESNTFAYSQLSQAEKEDPLKIYFLNDSAPHEVDTPIDVSDFAYKKEQDMTIRVVTKQLVYDYDGSGTGIGACSYDPFAIPAEATKIKFKFTTGNSYSTTTVKHKITIGVKAVYQQTQFVFPDDTDWLVQKTYDERNVTVEDYIDISSVTTPCYLMICGHGWDVTFENFWETELESSGNTQIRYRDVPYAVPNFHIFSTDEQEVGTWINGEIIYQKTINCGTISGSSSQAHNISNLGVVISITGVGIRASNNRCISIPYVNTNDNYVMQIEVDDTYIYWEVKIDTFNSCYITLQYTKTST